MRKIVGCFVLVGFVAVLAVVCNDISYAAPKEKAGKEELKTEKAPEAKVVSKFKTKEDMTQFEQLYVAKQATFGRMGVLQAYFSMEQNNLQEIDKQMEEKFKFKMDPNKMYDLNRETMEVREIGNVPQAKQ